MHSLEMKRSSERINNTGKEFIPSKILTNLRQSKKRTTSYLLVLPQYRSDWGISLGKIESDFRIFEWVNCQHSIDSTVDSSWSAINF